MKRQHPNVYNEIAMERRILKERLVVKENDRMSKRIIKLYHSFQDYNSLYFLVELHLKGGDMWSKLRYKGKMVGLHHSLVRRYLFELVEALEFIHSRGVGRYSFGYTRNSFSLPILVPHYCLSKKINMDSSSGFKS